MTTRINDQFLPVPDPFLDEANIQALSKTLAKSNGTTNYGRVLPGAPLGIGSDGDLRPCGNTTGTGSAVAAIAVAEADGFYIGDTIDVLSTLGIAGSVAFNANAVPEEITLTGKINDGKAHSVQLIDPSANDQLIRVEASVAAGVYTIGVYLATGVAGAITSKPADVCGALNATVGHILTATYDATTTAVTAVAAKTLAGGLAVGGAIASGAAVTAVNKTALTVSTAGALTVASGDIVRLTTGSTCVGLNRQDANTLTNQIDGDGAVIADVCPVRQVLSGIIDESEAKVQLTTNTSRARVYSAAVKAAIPNVIFI